MAVLARDLDRRLVGLEPRVAEKDFVEPGDLGDAVGGRLLVGDAPQVGRMDDAALDPVGEGSGKARVRVAEGVHRDAGERVEVLPAFLVAEPQAYAANERDRLPGVG